MGTRNMSLPIGTTNVALTLPQILMLRDALNAAEKRDDNLGDLMVLDALLDQGQLRCERALDREQTEVDHDH